MDDIHETKPHGLVIHFKNTHKNTSESQSMSELELLAKSGFLSIVGLTHIPHGEAKKVFGLP